MSQYNYKQEDFFLFKRSESGETNISNEEHSQKKDKRKFKEQKLTFFTISSIN